MSIRIQRGPTPREIRDDLDHVMDAAKASGLVERSLVEDVHVYVRNELLEEPNPRNHRVVNVYRLKFPPRPVADDLDHVMLAAMKSGKVSAELVMEVHAYIRNELPAPVEVIDDMKTVEYSEPY